VRHLRIYLIIQLVKSQNKLPLQSFKNGRVPTLKT